MPLSSGPRTAVRYNVSVLSSIMAVLVLEKKRGGSWALPQCHFVLSQQIVRGSELDPFKQVTRFLLCIRNVVAF